MTKGSAYGLRRSSTEYNNNNAWNVNFNSGNRNANNKNNGNYVRPVLAFGIKLRVRIKRDYGRLERTCFEIKRVACNLLLTEKRQQSIFGPVLYRELNCQRVEPQFQ